ncbi:uncharacterized protein ARMOST_05853 [Armillaria ostoyae]|uniref:CBM1 domain-containing protein n=1 Tax=Armillaria ostoyae TaxID=47428 RepID=A0A284R1E3_ARMOS|nr:uncharacterized protein ARMOST_05853 [Armillaria ostoyae]
MALAAVFLFAGQANAIASNPYNACNGHNHYGVGHTCAWKDSQGRTSQGICRYQNDELNCIAN